MKNRVCALALSMLLLGGCGATRHGKIYDDDRAIRGADLVTMATSIGQKTGDGAYELSATAQTGAQTVWEYTSKTEEAVTIDCVLEVHRGGPVKIVLISPDDSVLTMVEAAKADGEQEAAWFFSAPAGTWRVKIVAADSADFTAGFAFSHGAWGGE